MELKIKTAELKEMVNKASKCCSNNKLIPLTSLMNLKVDNNTLIITTTDATNYFYAYSVDKFDCEDFEISVAADVFTKLIQKTTSEHVILNLSENILKIKGNGSYTMELPLDENGSIIKFPKKFANVGDVSRKSEIIKASTVKTILSVNKAALAISVELPALTCYYCADKVVTSDSYKICATDIKVFNEPMLITSQLMELLGVLDCEDIRVIYCEDFVLFETEHDIVYSPITEGIETFPINEIKGLLDCEYESNCVVSRQAVLSVVDRLGLFVSPYDKKGIYLTFTADGVMFSSKKSRGTEVVPYISSENFENFTCLIDVEMFRTQIATQNAETLKLYYGSESSIKTENNNITQVISLMEDDRVVQE